MIQTRNPLFQPRSNTFNASDMLMCPEVLGVRARTC